VNPTVGEKPDIEAEKVWLGFPRDRVGDLIADSPSAAFVQQAETLVVSAGTRVGELQQLDIVCGERGQRLPDLAQPPLPVVD
jgi:hypothetical protein